jgi:type I restriction enzyme S subunit
LSKEGAIAGRLLPELSILVTCIGATIGKTGLARVSCATNQQINALVVDGQFLSQQYLFWFFTSPFGQNAIKRNASATTLPILNKSRFEALPVPIPPYEEQLELVARIESKFSVIEHMETDLEEKLQVAQALRQSILKHTFSGKLVKQNADDEPASVLLKRIAAEREERARLAKTAKSAIKNGFRKYGAAKVGA